tara:strand:- start:2416 stop:3612 length:1197 start_codon:yes stop_codon:yes gene_type:complete
MEALSFFLCHNTNASQYHTANGPMMKRPMLLNFLCVVTEDWISVRAAITMRENPLAHKFAKSNLNSEEADPRMPIQALRLLRSYEFKMKLVGLDSKQDVVFTKVYDSDVLGDFRFKIPLTEQTRKIEAFQVYEVGRREGLELQLGTTLPLKIPNPRKIIICDFDKTLVDTRYSTTKELYNSLTKPLQHFPTLKNSLEVLHQNIDDGFNPFILSASPHFYEEAMRDWLYQHRVYTAGIFLKDYRKVLSFLDGDLTPKDLKVQGLYKLNHLLDILGMTGVPDELVLMGDNFESDPVIYLTLSMILLGDQEPWQLWRALKANDAFQLSKRQDANFLDKLYQLSNQLERRQNQNKTKTKIKIYIRKQSEMDSLNVPDFCSPRINLIELYDGKPFKEPAIAHA